MTLKEIIIKEINTVELNKPANWQENFSNVLKELECITYETLIAEEDKDGFIIKVLIEAGKSYGKAKWDEALEAARNQMCEDCSTPPQFIP
ncbi:MAG: hypothetical protein M9958_03335 [Chitinophagales bacterium]|nr:hypothetical protein [Chitinophagales bacterium]